MNYVGPAVVKGVKPGQQIDVKIAQRADVVEGVTYINHPRDISMPKVGDTVFCFFSDEGNYAMGVIYTTNYNVGAGQRRLTGTFTSDVDCTFNGKSTSLLHAPE